MDYIHKFSIGPVEMDKMLEEYHQLRKTRRYCQACPNYGKYWSCPEYKFDEVLFLKNFKYMYLIAREYEVPREDKQKIFGIQQVGDYCKQVMQAIKVQSWQDLLALEKQFPGTMGLIPGNCHVCDISGEGCARPKGQKCRHPELMRFSLESLGFDVDAICKYEIGVLLLWPKEGHLPEKLCGVMALMTNEKIPMDALKAQFPDAKKNWLRFSETAPEARNEVRPTVKRQESWLDNMHKQNQAKAEDPSYKPPKSWIGFKSAALDSGDYVKSRPWAEDVPPAEQETPEAPDLNEVAEEVADGVSSAATEVQEDAPVIDQETIEVLDPTAKPEVSEPVAEEEDDSKYKWLGFKRTVEEAEEEFKKRPIPKFNVPEPEAPQTEETPVVTEPVAEAQPSEPVPVSEPEGQPVQTAPTVSQEPVVQVTAEVVQPTPQPVAQPAPQPAPMPEPEEEIEYLDPSSVTNALSAAIEIARDVVGDDFMIEHEVKAEPVVQKPVPQASEPVQTAATPEEEDDSKYKWLGYKATNLDEDDGFKKGGWKKNY